MNDHGIDFAKAYRFSRLGFFFLALGLILVCALDLPATITRLTSRPAHFLFWRWALESGASNLVGTVTPWATLVGSSLLWAAWESPAWKRRAALLMTMCLIDVGAWILDQGDPDLQGPNAFFRIQLGAALGWAQFALMAALSGDILTHLGVEWGEDSARTTRSLAAGGALVWLLLFFEIADLQAGWPLQRAPWVSLHAQVLSLANEVIHTACLVQVTALVIASFHRLNVEVQRPDADEPNANRDPFSDSDPGRESFTAV